MEASVLKHRLAALLCRAAAGLRVFSAHVTRNRLSGQTTVRGQLPSCNVKGSTGKRIVQGQTWYDKDDEEKSRAEIEEDIAKMFEHMGCFATCIDIVRDFIAVSSTCLFSVASSFSSRVDHASTVSITSVKGLSSRARSMAAATFSSPGGATRSVSRILSPLRIPCAILLNAERHRARFGFTLVGGLLSSYPLRILLTEPRRSAWPSRGP